MDSSSSRLDVVKWWRGRQELDARKELSDAQVRERSAKEEEVRLREALAAESRARGDAALWELSDASRAAGTKKLEAAVAVTAKAAAVRTEKQAVHLSAHQRLKAVEKVVESLLSDARAEADRKERRESDEIAVLRFARSA